MTKKEAKAELKKYGQCEYKNAEIWETVRNGEYTGRYRVAPKGQRELYDSISDESLTIGKAFEAAETI